MKQVMNYNKDNGLLNMNLIISGDKSKIPQGHQSLAESCVIEFRR